MIDVGLVKKNINLTIVEDIPKNSATPPQTPRNNLFFEDFFNFCIIITPPYFKNWTASN